MSTLDNPRQRLLDAAGPIFAETGYEGAKVREICDAAGANLAAINYYFGGKENLYIETVRHAYQTLATQVPLPEWPAGTCPETKLREFIRTFLNRVVVDREPAWAGRLIMREIFQPTKACMAFVEGDVHPNFRMLSGILHELLPRGTSPIKLKLTAFSIVGQCLHYRMARPILTVLVGEEEFRQYDLNLLAEHIASFSLAGIANIRAPAAQSQAEQIGVTP